MGSTELLLLLVCVIKTLDDAWSTELHPAPTFPALAMTAAHLLHRPSIGHTTFWCWSLIGILLLGMLCVDSIVPGGELPSQGTGKSLSGEFQGQMKMCIDTCHSLAKFSQQHGNALGSMRTDTNNSARKGNIALSKLEARILQQSGTTVVWNGA